MRDCEPSWCSNIISSRKMWTAGRPVQNPHPLPLSCGCLSFFFHLILSCCTNFSGRMVCTCPAVLVCSWRRRLCVVWRLGLFFCLLLSDLSTLCVCVCLFCTPAQLSGLVFPSLPVFASGGWGASVASRWSTTMDVDVESVLCVCECVVKLMESLRKCSSFGVCEHIFYFFGLTNPHASCWFLS